MQWGHLRPRVGALKEALSLHCIGRSISELVCLRPDRIARLARTQTHSFSACGRRLSPVQVRSLCVPLCLQTSWARFSLAQPLETSRGPRVLLCCSQGRATKKARKGRPNGLARAEKSIQFVRLVGSAWLACWLACLHEELIKMAPNERQRAGESGAKWASGKGGVNMIEFQQLSRCPIVCALLLLASTVSCCCWPARAWRRSKWRVQ